MKIIKFLVLIIVVSVISSCKKDKVFEVKGIISNAQEKTLYLGKRGFSDITIIDSVKIAKDGSFSIKASAPEYPDLYLLRLDEQSINISVDSTEIISLYTDADKFAIEYEVKGSDGTEKIRLVTIAKIQLNNTLNNLKKEYAGNRLTENEYLEKVHFSIGTYKEEIKKLIISNPKSPAAYFALFQKSDDYLILDPYDKDDSKMYAAVATAWDYYYKGAPRAVHLKDFTLSYIQERRNLERKLNMLENAVEGSADYYNIILPDVYNKEISLSSLRGKVVLLDFTVYEAEYAPVHNAAINEIYEKYKSRMEVYQVSFDPDLHFWQNASSNLPWICVRDANTVTSELVYKFNIQGLPAMFLLNGKGEIVKRLTVQDNIREEVEKVL